MENFIAHNPTSLHFGKGVIETIGKTVKPLGSKVLLVYGKGSVKRSGLYDRIVAQLNQAGATIYEYDGIQPNPLVADVDKAAAIGRENNVDYILAVGGGSVIDSAKAISIGIPYSGDVWEFFERKANASSAVPVGIVLTIPGSGSESSVVSVITNEESLIKRGYHSQVMLPKFAILNPELSFTLPPYQAASGAADIMAHTMERYFTQIKKTDLTDRLCESNLITVIENTPLVLRNPQDYDSQAEIMWASSIAHNGLLGTGRIEDWSSHKLAHELSSYYGVTHGAALAIIFPAWMKYVYKQNIERFVQFAVRVFGVDACFESHEKVALEGIRRLESFYKEIGLPITLKELDIGSEKFDEMATKCVAFGSIGNFMKLNKDDVINIYKLSCPA